ncbi:MAG: anthranilate synthase component II [Planctomycetota bacterium]|jgi:anthranilate synthase/aminodeoxychorismate synthase-like glutamine amidotransferase
MKRVLVLDNYDSFTFNLVQGLQELGAEVLVRKNDLLPIEEFFDLGASHLVLSPGPGRPAQAGVSLKLLAATIGKLPILGVCLGHQAIGEALGAEIQKAPRLMHGRSSQVYHDQKGLFAGLPNPFAAARYHSLIVSENSLPAELKVSAYTSQGEIMGLRHASLPVEGVQFHPESILTPLGERLLRNFLEYEASDRRVA